MRAGATSSGPQQLARVVQQLWQWWRREIAASVPASVKRWFARRDGRLIVTVAQETATFFEEFGNRRRRVGMLDLTDAVGPGAVREGIVSSTDEPILELQSDSALRSRVTLPLAADSNLAEVVSFELERHSPFRRDESYHAFTIIGRDAARQRILIELTVVPRSVVDEALARLNRHGIEIAVVRVAGGEAGVAASPNLLPIRHAARAPRLPRLAASILVVTGAVLAAATIALPMVHAHIEARRMDVLLQSLKQQASEAAQLQKKIDSLEQARGFLSARKRRILPVSDLLDMVTRVLPDDTWLRALRITGNDIEIVGSGASASAIIGLLDGSSGLSGAEFRSPVTPDGLHREQFDIGAHLGPARGQ